MNRAKNLDKEKSKGRKITDFFTSSPLSSVPSSSSPVRPVPHQSQHGTRSSTASTSKKDNPSGTVHATTASTARASKISTVDSDTRTSIGHQGSSLKPVINGTSTRKHVREPSGERHEDNTITMLDGTVGTGPNLLTSTPRKHPAKRARFSPSEDIVPSSQSDEMEERLLSEFPMTSELDYEEEMRVSNANNGSPSAMRGVEPTALPPTPKIISIEEKTARIKARILAEVANHQSPPSSPKRAFDPDLNMSSDEDGDDLFLLELPRRGAKATSASHQLDATLETQTSSSSRDMDELDDSSITSGPHSRPVRTRLQTLHQPTVPKPKPKPKRQGRKSEETVLIQSFIDEQKAAERRGRGSDALRLAEDSLDDKMIVDDELLDEQSAKNVASSFDSPSISLVDKSTTQWGINDDLLSEQAKKDILNVLKADKLLKLQEKERKVLGLSLWDLKAWDGLPMLNEAPSAICNVDASPIVKLIQRSRSAPLSKQKVLYSALGYADSVTAIDVLYDIAFSLSTSPSDSEPAYDALLHVWQSQMPDSPNLPFRLVMRTLIDLDIKPAAVQSLQPTLALAPRPPIIRNIAKRRILILLLLIRMIDAAVKSKAIASEDIASFVMTLTFISLDPTSTSDLRICIRNTLASFCDMVAISGDTEIASSIGERLSQFASGQSPVNQAHIVSSFAVGYHGIRLARGLAHALLTNDLTAFSAGPFALPRAEDIVDLLYPAVGFKTPFDVRTAQDEVDFDDVLAHHITLLSFALFGLDDYVAIESRVNATEDQPLVLIQNGIDRLRGEIKDARATHLDRSRAKLQLQNLSTRIGAQRGAAAVALKPSGKLPSNWLKLKAEKDKSH